MKVLPVAFVVSLYVCCVLSLWRGRIMNAWQVQGETEVLCKKGYNATTDEIEPLLRGEVNSTHDAKCVVKCILEIEDGIRIDRETGEFNKEELLDQINNDGTDYYINKEAIERCTKQVEVDLDDECSSIINFSGCIWAVFRED